MAKKKNNAETNPQPPGEPADPSAKNVILAPNAEFNGKRTVIMPGGKVTTVLFYDGKSVPVRDEVAAAFLKKYPGYSKTQAESENKESEG